MKITNQNFQEAMHVYDCIAKHKYVAKRDLKKITGFSERKARMLIRDVLLELYAQGRICKCVCLHAQLGYFIQEKDSDIDYLLNTYISRRNDINKKISNIQKGLQRSKNERLEIDAT